MPAAASRDPGEQGLEVEQGHHLEPLAAAAAVPGRAPEVAVGVSGGVGLTPVPHSMLQSWCAWVPG
jgi:hypothetical protein